MHDSERSMNHSLEMSSNALARSLLSASHMLILPHSETYTRNTKRSSSEASRVNWLETSIASMFLNAWMENSLLRKRM